MGYFIEWPGHICERLGCWVNTRRKLKTTRLSALGVLLSQQFVRHIFPVQNPGKSRALIGY